MLTERQLHDWACQCGFDDAGIAEAVFLEEDAAVLSRWIEAGCHGSMAYMERNQQLRTDPRQLVPGCRTMLVCVLSYNKQDKQPAGAPYIAKSGLSGHDYHFVVKERLQRLESVIAAAAGADTFSAEHQHLFCDSAPVLERRWAERAQLGFIGKNHLFIHPVLGSYVHIGILALQKSVQKDSQLHSSIPSNPCGDCDRCLRACPTGALRAEMFDARRCVSYLTIERKEPLPQEHAGAAYMGLYGCDCCGRVCRYNQDAPYDLHADLAANPLFLKMTREDWAALSHKQKEKLLHRIAK